MAFVKTRAAIAFEKAMPLEITRPSSKDQYRVRFWLKSRQREFALPTSSPCLAPMITDTLTLENINQGFDLAHKGESIRGVVVY